jgi:hypothetical protein
MMRKYLVLPSGRAILNFSSLVYRYVQVDRGTGRKRASNGTGGLKTAMGDTAL